MLLAIFSFFIIAALIYRDFKSGVLISILLVTAIAVLILDIVEGRRVDDLGRDRAITTFVYKPVLPSKHLN